MKARFQAATVAWEKDRSDTDAFNESETRRHQAELAKWIDACSEWENRKIAFYKDQQGFNSGIDQLHENYEKHEQNAVEQYCEMVLNNSKYPDIISKDFELLYNPETKILICEYYLPDPENMPRLREVKYVASRGELKQTFITDSQAEKMYDALIYQIVLRIIHELFEADVAGAVEAISLNGRVRFISKATGKAEEACIVSIQVKKDQFLEVELKNVDPKTCFKTFKGIGS